MQVVLYANTKAEWMISAIGAFKHSLAIVTIYTNLGEDGVQHGITQVSFYPSLCFWLVLIMIQTNISTAVEDFIGLKSFVAVDVSFRTEFAVSLGWFRLGGWRLSFSIAHLFFVVRFDL